MTARENARIAREVYAHFDDELDLALDHVEVELYYDGLSFRGKDGFRNSMAHHKSPFPDGKVEIISQSAGEDGVTNECVYRATHTEPIPTPDGTEVPPTRKKIEARFCEALRFEGDKVKSSTDTPTTSPR
ncbi:MAG: ester cyclase [Rubrobacteraceae bacterium]